MVILKVQDLIKSYGGRKVVNGVSFHVNQGEIVGLLGRNGAGKTTSFRMTIGMIGPDGGQVVFEGHDVSKLPMYKRARLGMGYLAQEPSVFQRLSVEQNLRAILETRPLSRKDQRETAERLMEQFGLTKLRKQQARTLSGGERRKLEIARTLITDPSLILLDEPFSGVDPIAVEELQAEVRRLCHGENIAILITDHNAERTMEVCDRVYIIDNGKVLCDGPPAELSNNELVRKVYLGQGFRGIGVADAGAPGQEA
jgi:lipopolysaccharide export system ATP-binding protein